MEALDIIICVTATVYGAVLGMDKSHDIRDYVGPFIMFCGGVYAFWQGLMSLGVIISIILLYKLVRR